MNTSIPVRIVRVDKTLPLPDYQSKGAVAFDVYSRIAMNIPSGETAFVPTNLIIEVPTGYALILAARSSLWKKKGLMMRNSIGVVDQDYNGDTDEILLALHNDSSSSVAIERGERLAQGLIMPVAIAQWEDVESINSVSRGGFGATGS